MMVKTVKQARERIVWARRNHKKTQIQMAKLLRVSQGTYSKLENNETTPSLKAWLNFCRHFRGDAC